MVRPHNRGLVSFHVFTDAMLGMVGFLLAYVLRFETGLFAITRGQPPIEQYFGVLPFIALRVPPIVWGIFLVCNIILGYLSRKFIREALERRWMAGVGLRRVLIAGAGDLGRVVADRMLE